MKVLFLTPYTYDPLFDEFKKNKTGFGMMVNSIGKTISSMDNDVLCLTHAFTNGRDNGGISYVKHSLLNFICNLRISGLIKVSTEILHSGLKFKMKLRWLFYYLDSGFVKQVILKEKPDIVHIHGLGIGTKYYIDICEELCVPYLVTAHGLIENAPEATEIDKIIEREFFVKSKKDGIPVSVISTGMKNRLISQEYYGLDNANNIEVITNGINTKQTFHSTNVRKAYGITNDKRILLSIGSICEGKNQIQLVRAINLLPLELKRNIVVFIIGTISSDYPIIKEIEKLNLSNVIILPGFLPFEQLSSYYREADLVVMTSKEEGFGLSLVEGFVYGTPSLTFSDLDAVPDIFDQCAMQLCENRTDESLARSIEKALKQTWDKKEIIDYCKKFSLENMGIHYENMYRKIVMQKSGNKDGFCQK